MGKKIQEHNCFWSLCWSSSKTCQWLRLKQEREIDNIHSFAKNHKLNKFKKIGLEKFQVYNWSNDNQKMLRLTLKCNFLTDTLIR